MNLRFEQPNSSYLASIVLAAVLTTCCGCGPRHPPTYPVEGSIVFADGEVVRIGSVEFRLESPDAQGERTIARGKISEDGSFHLTTFEPNDGAMEGTHQVTVHQFIVVEDRSFKSHGHGRRVSAKYADYATSGLTATVRKANPNDKETNRIKIQLAIEPHDKGSTSPRR